MKNFKIFLLTFLLLIGFSPAFCAENAGVEANLLTRKLAKYPEVLVKYGKNEIKRVQAYELLKYHDLKDVDDAEFDDLLRSAVEEKIYSDIVVFFLEKYNVKPSYQMAYDYLIKSQEKLPLELVKLRNKDKNLQELASDKQYQLTVAALMYLKKHYPASTGVTAEEIEFFYRANQNVFMYEAKVSVGFLAIEKQLQNSRALINQALNKLKQGVPFDRLAKDFNKDLPKKFYEPLYQANLLEKAAELKSGEYSDILEFDDSYAIVMVKKRELPEYIPLENCSFFIQSIIEGRKCAVELENILDKSLQLIDIDYFF